jgi:Methylamine utilisation protein MauE
MIDPVLMLLIALGGSVLFGTAAFHKLRSPAAFGAALADYHVVPGAVAPAAATALVLLETAVACGLLWGRARPVCATVGAALLLLYASAIALNLLRGRRDLDCGCGSQGTAIGWWMVARNALLAALLLIARLPAATRELSLGDVATIGASLTVAALLYMSAALLLGRSARRALFSTEHS